MKQENRLTVRIYYTLGAKCKSKAARIRSISDLHSSFLLPVSIPAFAQYFLRVSVLMPSSSANWALLVNLGLILHGWRLVEIYLAKIYHFQLNFLQVFSLKSR